MKKRFLKYAVVFAFLLATLSQLSAAPVGRSNSGRDYLLGTQDLGAWSAGLYGMNIDREVTLWNDRPKVSMNSKKIVGYVGYDILPWITTYVTAGSTQTRIGWGSTGSSKPEYGVGCMLGLFDTEIEDPTLLEDRLRLNANFQYTRGSGAYADGFSGNISWSEFSGSLTLSIVNDLEGDKFFVPNSIALFIGPAFSFLSSSEIEQDSSFGLTLGIDVFLNEKVSLEFAYISYEESAYSAGVNVRF